jgi:hypothetical protein
LQSINKFFRCSSFLFIRLGLGAQGSFSSIITIFCSFNDIVIDIDIDRLIFISIAIDLLSNNFNKRHNEVLIFSVGSHSLIEAMEFVIGFKLLVLTVIVKVFVTPKSLIATVHIPDGCFCLG